MEFRFDLPAGLAKTDWDVFFRVYYRINPGVRVWHWVIRLLCSAVGLLQLLLTVGFLVSEEPSPAAALVTALIGAAALAYGAGFGRLLRWTSRRNTAGADERMVVCIGEDGVTDRTGAVTTHYDFSVFTGLFYCRDAYLLFFSKKQALVLPERSRTGGSSPELRRFLEEKTGITVKTIK